MRKDTGRKATLLRKSCKAVLCMAGMAASVIVGSESAQAVTLNWSAVKEPGVGGSVTSIAVCPADSNKIIVGGDMLGPTYSTDGGATWNDTYGLKNWECGDATWRPGSSSEVWIGTMGGPYKSTDGGRNWVEKRGGMPAAQTYWGFTTAVQKVLYDPNNSSRLLAFGGSHRNWDGNGGTKWGAVWESTNNGDTWTLKTTIAPDVNGQGANVYTAMFAPGSSSVLFAAVKDKGVYKSANGGSSWSPLNNGLPNSGAGIRFLAIHPTNSSILYCSLNGKRTVYKTTDGGANWVFSGNGINFDSNYDHGYPKIAISQSNPNVLYVANDNWKTIFKTTDGGANWSDVSGGRMPSTPTGLGPQGYWIEIDPNNENVVYMNNSVHIFKTTNGATSWTDTSSKPGIISGTWQGRGYSGYVSTQVKWNPYNTNQVVLMAMDDGKFMQSTDMTNWRMHGSSIGDWAGGNDVTFGADGNTMYASFGQHGWYDGVAKSTDGGLNWNYVTSPGSGDAGAIYTNPNNTAQVWYIRGGRLYYSSSSGAGWSEISVGGNTNLQDIAADKNNPLTFYVTARNGVYKTTNGSSFNSIAGIEWSEQSRICIDPSNANRFYVASWNYNQWHSGIWRYDNGTWTRISNNVYAFDVAVDPSDPNRVIYVTNHNPGVDNSQATGIWMTENALAATPTWTQQNNGLPMLRGMTIAFHPSNGAIIVGLNGRGFYKASVSGDSAQGQNLLANPGFEAEQFSTQTPSGWSETSSSGGVGSGFTSTSAKVGGNYGGEHSNSAAFNMYTYQTKTGLVNGLYTLRAWVRGSDWSNTQLEVKDYGGSTRSVHFGTDWVWRQVEIKDINVTNGQATIGIWSNNGNTWKKAQFDDVEFFKQGSTTTVTAPTLGNGGFETPSTSSYIYNPAGGSWTFSGNAGIQRNGSAWGASTALQGVQTAFLQGNPNQGAALGSISQSVNFSSGGAFTLTFQAARRSGQVQPIKVSVDGVQVGSTITPVSNAFASYTTSSFTVTAGNHTIKLEATANTGDNSTFVDDIKIN